MGNLLTNHRKQSSKPQQFVLSLPEHHHHGHEKNHSLANMSVSTIPLDRISVMAPSHAPSDPSEDSIGTHGHGGIIHGYHQNALKEADEPMRDVLSVHQSEENVSDHEDQFVKS